MALCRVALLACTGAAVHRTVPTQGVGGRSRAAVLGAFACAGLAAVEAAGDSVDLSLNRTSRIACCAASLLIVNSPDEL